MRFREEQFKKIYPAVDIGQVYVLWVDILAYFEYRYDSVEVKVTLQKRDRTSIPIPKIRQRKPFPNKMWHIISALNGNKIVNGIPLIFDTFEELSSVNKIHGLYKFCYKFKNGTLKYIGIDVQSVVSFVKSDERDYHIEIRTCKVTCLSEILDEFIDKNQSFSKMATYSKNSEIHHFRGTKLKISAFDAECNSNIMADWVK